MVMEIEVPEGWLVEGCIRIKLYILEDVKLKYTGSK